MKNVLILAAHPTPAKSRFNKAWIEAAGKEGYTTHTLVDRILPDGHFNLAEEHLLVSGHRHIVMSFPLWWYSTPWMLNKWFSEVLTADFAFDKGHGLQGKTLSCLITYSGPHEVYTKGEPLKHRPEDFLIAMPAIANFCGMTYIAPYIFVDTDDISDQSINESTAGALAHLEMISKS